MYAVELKFRIARRVSGDIQLQAIWSVLGLLRFNGNILGMEFAPIPLGHYWFCRAFTPAKDSLQTKHYNEFLKKSLAELPKMGLRQPVAKVFGLIPESAERCFCRKHQAFYLSTNFLSVESPLRCFKCGGTSPLYEIPHHLSGQYGDVLTWQEDYKACDTLQMNCSTGERFALREMTDVGSSLSVRGRNVCQQITNATGVPTYYDLFRYKSRTTISVERKRKCPQCRRQWILKRPILRFDFKCDHCRLVSTVSSTVT